MTTREGVFNGTKGRVFYRVWEPEEHAQRATIIVHGYAEHIGRYDDLASALARDQSVVYGCDLFGHGRSDGERAFVSDVEDYVEDVNRLAGILHHEHAGLPVVMIGHSMGGLVATRYAQEHGERLSGLVLSSPILGNWQLAHDLLADERKEPLDEALLSRDPAVGAAYVLDRMVYRGPFKRTTLKAILRAMERATADAGELEVPVLSLHGEDDRVVPPGPSRAGVEGFASPERKVVIYPGARHEVFNEINRGEVLAEVVAFIHRVSAGRRVG